MYAFVLLVIIDLDAQDTKNKNYIPELLKDIGEDQGMPQDKEGNELELEAPTYDYILALEQQKC